MTGPVVVLGLALLLYPAGAASAAQGPAPGELERYAQEGQRAVAERRWADAARAYEKLGELSPETAEVHAQLGMIYFEQRDFARAVPALRKALKLSPRLPNADILLAMCLSELGQYKEALPGLQKGFAQSSDSALRRTTGLHLQRSYMGLGQDDKAVEVALSLARLYRDDPEVLYHTGRLFSNYAYLMTMRLAKTAPDSTWMHQAAGEANESQGFSDAALRDYREVLAADPDRPGIHFRIARTLLSRAEQASESEAAAARAEAARELEKELRLDPTNANAAYELGEIQRKAGRLELAQPLFERAVTQDPDFKEAQIGLSRVLIARGQAAAALPHLQKAVALDPANEVPYYQLSLVYRDLGNAAEQRRALAEYERRHAAKPKAPEPTFAPQQVTRQQVDKE